MEEEGEGQGRREEEARGQEVMEKEGGRRQGSRRTWRTKGAREGKGERRSRR